MTDLPEASFLNFLHGLGNQALMQFGDATNPQTGAREQNLPFARYTVQLLEVLRDKTEGNRSDEESAYLEGILAEFTARLEKLAE